MSEAHSWDDRDAPGHLVAAQLPPPPAADVQWCAVAAAADAGETIAIACPPPIPRGAAVTDDDYKDACRARAERFTAYNLQKRAVGGKYDRLWELYRTPTAFHQISLGADGSRWALDYQATVFTYQRVPLSNFWDWQRLGDATLQYLSVGNKCAVWGIDTDGCTVARCGFSNDVGAGTTWTPIDGPRLAQISVADDGSVWAIERETGRAVYRAGSATSAFGHTWIPALDERPEDTREDVFTSLRCIAHASRFCVFGVTALTGALVYRYGVSSDKDQWAGTHWHPLDCGGATLQSISCTADGALWGVTADTHEVLDLAPVRQRLAAWPGAATTAAAEQLRCCETFEIAEAITKLLDAEPLAAARQRAEAAFVGRSLRLERRSVIDAALIHPILGRDCITLPVLEVVSADVMRRCVTLRLAAPEPHLRLDVSLRLASSTPNLRRLASLLDVSVAMTANDSANAATTLLRPVRSVLHRFGIDINAVALSRVPLSPFVDVPFASIASYRASCSAKRQTRRFAVETTMNVLGVERNVLIDIRGHLDALTGTCAIISELPRDTQFASFGAARAASANALRFIDVALRNLADAVRSFGSNTKSTSAAAPISRMWLALCNHPTTVTSMLRENPAAEATLTRKGFHLVVQLSDVALGAGPLPAVLGPHSVLTASLDEAFESDKMVFRTAVIGDVADLFSSANGGGRIGGALTLKGARATLTVSTTIPQRSFVGVAIEGRVAYKPPMTHDSRLAFESRGTISLSHDALMRDSIVGRFEGDCSVDYFNDVAGSRGSRLLARGVEITVALDATKRTYSAGGVTVRGSLTVGGRSYPSACLAITCSGELAATAPIGDYDAPVTLKSVLLSLPPSITRLPPSRDAALHHAFEFTDAFAIRSGELHLVNAHGTATQVNLKSEEGTFLGRPAAIEIVADVGSDRADGAAVVTTTARCLHAVEFGNPTLTGTIAALIDANVPLLGPAFQLAIGDRCKSRAAVSSNAALRFANDAAMAEAMVGSTTWRALSNYGHSPICVDGAVFATVEHFVQSQKFVTVSDADVELVRVAPTPGEAAAVIRDPTKRIRKDWTAVRETVMHEALRRKFSQHRDLAAALLETGSARLVFVSTETFWGVCAPATTPDAAEEGQNVLGEMLMAMRAELCQTALNLWRLSPVAGCSLKFLGGLFSIQEVTTALAAECEHAPLLTDARLSELSMAGQLRLGKYLLTVEATTPMRSASDGAAAFGSQPLRVNVSVADTAVVEEWLRQKLRSVTVSLCAFDIAQGRAAAAAAALQQSERDLGIALRAQASANSTAHKVEMAVDESVREVAELRKHIESLHERIDVLARKELEKSHKAEWYALERVQLEAQVATLQQHLDSAMRVALETSTVGLRNASASAAQAALSVAQCSQKRQKNVATHASVSAVPQVVERASLTGFDRWSIAAVTIRANLNSSSDTLPSAVEGVIGVRWSNAAGVTEDNVVIDLGESDAALSAAADFEAVILRPVAAAIVQRLMEATSGALTPPNAAKIIESALCT